jgi:uncharacterized membrane protein
MSETPDTPQRDGPQRDGPQPDGPQPDAQKPRRTGRGVKIALAVSLAFNLLILGLVGGAVLGRPDPGGAPAIRTLGLGPFALALPGEARDDIRGRIEANMPELRRNRAEIGRSLMAVRRALLADPFDRAAAARALGRSREAAMALQAQGHGALLDTLDQMSAAERAIVADRLARTLRRLERREP